ISILPQDVAGLQCVLPPSPQEVRDTFCVIFCRGKFHPSREAIAHFQLILLSRNIIKSIINFLITENEWYRISGVMFNCQNLENNPHWK
ncbi:hypothetical protein F5J12DRAFT_722846, partial [Pisolithus orientalis]|uniref:uncharacterized protein n=1 Tax=Pisolithus orientalis TaxID=936130 RepID=UPI002225742B